MQKKTPTAGDSTPEKPATPGGSAAARGKKTSESGNDVARPGEDYREASGRDHPAESEHDHARQKLNGKSAEMAKDKSPRKDPEES